MAIKYIIVLFVETPRKFITAKLSIRKPGSSSVLIISRLAIKSNVYTCLAFETSSFVCATKSQLNKTYVYA